MGDTITKVEAFDILDGGEVEDVGVAVTGTLIACLLTLCLASFLWVPDMTCQPKTGKPRRELMVPS